MNCILPIIAMAAPSGAQGQGSGIQMIGMLVIFGAIMYFMLFRPQQRKEKEHRKMIDNTKSGDRVMFSGGIMGTITNVKDKTFVVKIADKVKIEVLRGAITRVLEKGEKITEEEK